MDWIAGSGPLCGSVNLPLGPGWESRNCGICDSPELFLASQIFAGTIAHDCWQRPRLLSGPWARRSGAGRKLVVVGWTGRRSRTTLSLPPGLIDVPPPGFPASLSKTSVSKLIDIHCPESIPVAAMEGISRRPRMQSAQLSQLVAVDPPVVMVAVDVVVISGTQRAP